LIGIGLASCHRSSTTYTYVEPPKQNIDLFVGSKQITEVYVDSTRIDLSTTDSYAFPLKLQPGSHIATWRFGDQELDCTFTVGVGDGSLSVLRRPPFVEFEGSVLVKVKPKPHK
jgi:hypothetical protein